ncbi:spindle and kinetochore-associated protein 1-like protein isoform X3 [Cucumis melo var. makuwa]|uniref:Spindle and kinetochore-associated protein 1-like protein isoform X3 n=1 Tax=Cucumis melo var. makuwa TaxID=1194695 RepID=A0A5D3E3K4_CUCMM|nr:spindle and kinetochore-associated protein 1-like protein isoform X3 [Cucumis melo var. makuwa]
MDSKEAGSLLDNLIVAFNGRIAELQDLVIARNMYPASCLPDLSAVDASLKVMELQVQAIKNQLREEAEAIPKAKKLIEASLKQQKRLESISLHVPTYYQILPERVSALNLNTSLGSEAKTSGSELGSREAENVISVLPKEKKVSSPPLWYITIDELNSLSSYMRGRLTVDKVNAAVNDMATYAEANAQLIGIPKKKLAENLWEKALSVPLLLFNALYTEIGVGAAPLKASYLMVLCMWLGEIKDDYIALDCLKSVFGSLVATVLIGQLTYPTYSVLRRTRPSWARAYE